MDHAEPTIRQAESTDTSGIHALISKVYAEHGCILDVERDERHRIYPGSTFRSGGGKFWVVESGGRIVAAGAVTLHADSAELKTLDVHPAVRRKGYARRLIELAVRHSQKAALEKMSSWSDTRFITKHQIYESMGFSGRPIESRKI